MLKMLVTSSFINGAVGGSLIFGGFRGVVEFVEIQPLAMFPSFDFDVALEYLRLLRMPWLYARLGFLLDRHAEKLFFKGKSRDAFLRGFPEESRIWTESAQAIAGFPSGISPYLRHSLPQLTRWYAREPIADALCDEFPFFAWLLRAESFRRFGDDPDGVFFATQDTHGFTEDHHCDILVEESAHRSE